VPIGAVRGTALTYRARDLIQQLTLRLWRYLGYSWDFCAVWECQHRECLGHELHEFTLMGMVGLAA